MLIDCETCAARGAACSGCLVTALLDAPRSAAGLTADERRAIEVFARAGFGVEVIETVATSVRIGGRSRRRPRAA